MIVHVVHGRVHVHCTCRFEFLITLDFASSSFMNLHSVYIIFVVCRHTADCRTVHTNDRCLRCACRQSMVDADHEQRRGAASEHPHQQPALKLHLPVPRHRAQQPRPEPPEPSVRVLQGQRYVCEVIALNSRGPSHRSQASKSKVVTQGED